MKVGLIARAEDRGLGVQSWEFFRHIKPERTLVIDMGELARGFEPHYDRYPGATVVGFRGGQLPEAEVRAWLEGLDAIFAAETLYDWHLADWAREAGARTVVQLNPEFFHHGESGGPPAPDAWWAPTPWRMEHLPKRTRLVPVPVAADRFATREARVASHEPLRVLHVVGHRAAADRNGTLQLFQALRHVREPIHVRLVTQDPQLPRIRSQRTVTVETVTGGVADYWRLYDDADVLVMPRRYGGLCLPVQEALAAGLAVVMTDCPPNQFWPIIPVRATTRTALTTATGQVPMYAAHPGELGRTLNHLAAEREAVELARRAGRAWVAAHSWEVMLPTYEAELAAVADQKTC